MNFKTMDQDLLYRAIRDGISDGLFRIATNDSDMPTHELFESIELGVKKGMAAICGDDGLAAAKVEVRLVGKA